MKTFSKFFDDSLKKYSLKKSGSFNEFSLKMMLAGEVVSKMDCLEVLFEMAFMEDSVSRKALNMLKSASENERLKGFFLDKGRLGDLVLKCAKKMEADKDGSVFTVLWNTIPCFLESFLTYFAIVSTVDRNFIPMLRDSEENNLLMIFAKILNFESKMNLLTRALGREQKLDAYFSINTGSNLFFRVLVSKLKCDPFFKNKHGICFADFVSDECLKEKLGYSS